MYQDVNETPRRPQRGDFKAGRRSPRFIMWRQEYAPNRGACRDRFHPGRSLTGLRRVLIIGDPLSPRNLAYTHAIPIDPPYPQMDYAAFEKKLVESGQAGIRAAAVALGTYRPSWDSGFQPLPTVAESMEHWRGMLLRQLAQFQTGVLLGADPAESVMLQVTAERYQACLREILRENGIQF